MILSQDCVIYTEGRLLTETVTIYLFSLNDRSRRKGFEIQTDTIFNASSSPVARRRRYIWQFALNAMGRILSWLF